MMYCKIAQINADILRKIAIVIKNFLSSYRFVFVNEFCFVCSNCKKYYKKKLNMKCENENISM